MEWVFQPHEAKNKKLRVIRITDPEILEIVRRQMAKYPKGPIFRGMNGKPWQANNFRRRFVELRHRLEAKGMEFDADCCMYSTRTPTRSGPSRAIGRESRQTLKPSPS